jgi:acyl transferase domain-containing protein/acyl carrier protein
VTDDRRDTDYRALLARAVVKLDQLQARVDTLERARHEPIAIVGLGCRLPGGADDPDALWRLLREGRDAVREVPAERWDVDAYYDPTPGTPGKTYCRSAALLDGVDQFDPQFFGIAPREAEAMDPQQRLLLEVTWEALERAAIPPTGLGGTRTGVFVGIVTGDYSLLATRTGDTSRLDGYFGAGIAHSIAAGRLSYVLGLQGPSVAVDTACSSSLLAVHLACQSLRLGECNLAIAAGVNLILSPECMIMASQARMLSPDGRCKAFDASADGYGRAEGCAVVVLRRLSDALASGDNILAVIRGTAANQDGRSQGITAPNRLAQEAVIREALADGDVAATDVSYVEAHGTGTSLGDPIEVEALAAVLGAGRPAERPVLVGSIKSNVGHLEGAAGMAGLAKLVLSLMHGELPRHLHFARPNPHIAWERLPVQVVTAHRAWERGPGRRIGGVSSFGFSGTNVHLVVEEAPARAEDAAPAPVDRPLHVLTLSAKSEAGLRDLAGRVERHLAAADGGALADVAFTANAGRSPFRHRLALVSGAREDAREALASVATGTASPALVVGRPDGPSAEVAFLFTGQGSQYAGMGRALYDTEPVFREALDRCATLLGPELDRSLLSVLYPESGADALLDETAYTQPALFAFEYALAALWQAWGVRPSMVIGHSVGEYAAACLAGVLTLEDALRLVAARGRLMQALPATGAMVAVLADEARVRAAVAPHADRVAIAAVNGPANVVISGERAAVEGIARELAAAGIGTRPLTVSHAFHSPLMEPMLAAFAARTREVTFRAPAVPLVSNLTGRLAGDAVVDPAYWVRHVREPVRFADGLRTLAEAGPRIVLEIGPGPVLLGLAAQAGVTAEGTWLASLRRGRDDWAQILESLATLWVRGAPVDWIAFDRARNRRRIALPTSAFQRQRFWRDGLEVRSRPATDTADRPHALLGRRIHTPLAAGLFESRVGVDQPGWLADHRMYGAVLFPAVGFLEMARVASAMTRGPGKSALADVVLHEVLTPRPGEPRTVQLVLSAGSTTGESFQIFSRPEADETASWALHVTGRLVSEPDPLPGPGEVSLPALKERCREPRSGEACYAALVDAGVDYGPSFRRLDTIWRGSDEALARLHDRADVDTPDHLPPGLLAAALQLFAAVLDGQAGAEQVFCPVSLGVVHLEERARTAVWAHVRTTSLGAGGAGFEGDVVLLNEAGEVVGEMRRVAFRPVPRATLERVARRSFDDWLYELSWRPVALPESRRADAPGAWVILADAAGVGVTLAARLAERGDACVVVRPGPRYERADAGVARLDPADPTHYRRLLDEVRGSSGLPLRGVVHLWAMDTAPVDGADSGALEAAQALACGSTLHLVQALVHHDGEAPVLWLVTRGGQAVQPGDGPSPIQSALWGLGRVIALEHPELRCVRVDLDPRAEPAVAGLQATLEARDGEDQVAFRAGVRHVARLTRRTATPVPARRAEPRAEPASILTPPDDGILDHLALRPATRRAPGRGEVEIRVRAAGLNFRDVLNALGMYPGPAGPLGSECAGTIVAVGEDVEGLEVGAEVIALGSGCFSTFVTTSATTVVRRPATLDVETAAGVPLVFLTAEYGLNRLAGIARGDRVLIHAACGGVGLAAVRLAQKAGAEVFATAGSPEKRAFLESLGVRHVMDSRSLTFADEVMARTGGEGVDVVLNSLAGEFIARSMAVLRPGGRFLEIGKRGIWDAERARRERGDVRYVAYDLADVLRDDPALFRAMLVDLVAAFVDGTLAPLPRRLFPLSAAAEAFRFMAQARHIGKIVLTLTDVETAGDAGLPRPVRADATYLVTGGLGGLGLEIAAGLVAEGARSLVLMGRRPPSAVAAAVVERLREAGAEVVVVQVDVSDREQLRRALAGVAGTMPPLRGVVHAAGVLDDGMLAQQTWPRFAHVLAPKAAGAWNLHVLTAEAGLDFFVLFSSIASTLGAPGQGNYAAANAFMDGLAHLRRSRGLPALSINWGGWSQVGMAAGLEARHDRRRAQAGLGVITPRDGVDVFAELRGGPSAQVAVVPVDWPVFARRFAAGPPAILEALVTGGRAPGSGRESRDGADLVRRLTAAPGEDRHEILAGYVTAQVTGVLGVRDSLDLDRSQGLTELGMDSLMAVELKNRLEAGVGRRLPPTLAFDWPTIDALAAFLLNDVFQLPAAVAAAAPAGTPDQSADGCGDAIVLSEQNAATLLARLDTFSDGEVDALLQRLLAEGRTAAAGDVADAPRVPEGDA